MQLPLPIKLPSRNRWFVVKVPLSTPNGKKKPLMVNINIYRNKHFQVVNKQKIEFARIVKNRLRSIPQLDSIWIHYKIFSYNRKFDTMNYGSIVDKYFADSLTANGIIKDDDWKNVVFTSFEYGGKCDKKEPPYALVYIIETIKDKKPMKIQLSKQEVLEAVQMFVDHKYINCDVSKAASVVVIDKQGNAVNDYDVEITLNEYGDATESKPESVPSKETASNKPRPEEKITEQEEEDKPPKKRVRRTKKQIADDLAAEQAKEEGDNNANTPSTTSDTDSNTSDSAGGSEKDSDPFSDEPEEESKPESGSEPEEDDPFAEEEGEKSEDSNSPEEESDDGESKSIFDGI